MKPYLQKYWNAKMRMPLCAVELLRAGILTHSQHILLANRRCAAYDAGYSCHSNWHIRGKLP